VEQRYERKTGTQLAYVQHAKERSLRWAMLPHQRTYPSPGGPSHLSQPTGTLPSSHYKLAASNGTTHTACRCLSPTAPIGLTTNQHYCPSQLYCCLQYAGGSQTQSALLPMQEVPTYLCDRASRPLQGTNPVMHTICCHDASSLSQGT
jgi:hypothetical protein